TALLATTPGNIGVVASIAADYARNLPLVSLVQLLRFTSVMLVMPSIASVLVTNVALRHSPHQSMLQFLWQLLAIPLPTAIAVSGLLAIALVAAYLGSRFKIPMAAFLGAIVIGLIADNASLLMPSLSFIDLTLPLAFSLVGQILLGITIGEHSGINPPLKPAIIARAAIPVSLMFLATAAFAGIIHSLTAWHWLTCLLIAAPGGSPEMIWIALTLHQDTEIVTAGHIIRLLTINLALPFLLFLVNYYDRQLDTTQQ
ncbi:MAG: AbrB family transcriptional regulator, partial [Coleofasciculus sp. S288]|nr:AbrB family transcriptional regulator [Coleofasciculus sp. S288]